LQSVQLIYARTYETIPMLLVACGWYLFVSILLNYPQSKIEAHYSKSRRALRLQLAPVPEVAEIPEMAK